MANEIRTKANEIAQANKPSKPAQATKQTQPVAKITLGIAVVALFASLYAGFANLQLQQDIKQQATSFTEQLKQQQITSKNEFVATAQLADQAQIRITELTKNLQAAMQQPHYQKQDWLLLKARYYLELAHINAHWSQDTNTTIALLKQADALLTAIPEPKLLSVRQAIAKDVTTLQTQPKIDVVGLLSQLDATQELIPDLPLKLPLSASSSTAEKPNLSWREQLKQSMHTLKNLLVIRRNDGDFRALLSPTGHALLCESIQLNLQQAQWAILQNSAGVYQISLGQAIKDIKKAFDENAQTTQSLLKELQTLQQIKLVAPKPIVDESLPLLNQIIDANTSLSGFQRTASLFPSPQAWGEGARRADEGLYSSKFFR